jgi:hypothetical protein
MSTSEKPWTPEPIALSPKDTARVSSLGLTTIYKLINEGRLESTTVNGRRLIFYASLKKLLGAA